MCTLPSVELCVDESAEAARCCGFASPHRLVDVADAYLYLAERFHVCTFNTARNVYHPGVTPCRRPSSLSRPNSKCIKLVARKDEHLPCASRIVRNGAEETRRSTTMGLEALALVCQELHDLAANQAHSEGLW